MELTFPFRNMSINDILRFLDPYTILDYIDFTYQKDPNAGITYQSHDEIFHDSIPNFESELLQIIATSDQQTIDTYFESLWLDIVEIKNRFEFSSLSLKIQEFNDRILNKFEKKIEEETAVYLSDEKRKMTHLERYEDLETSFLTFESRKVSRINYNFYCVKESPKVIDTSYLPAYHQLISGFAEEFFAVASRYGRRWKAKEIVSKHVTIKPVLYLEGDLDIRYIRLAAAHLEKNALLAEIHIRQRGGYKNLDSLWTMFKRDNWETFIQKKLLLFDCDTNKTDEDFGHIFRRTIPTVPENPIKKGIENLFPESLIHQVIASQRKLVDSISTKKIERGVESESFEYIINHQEKTNFCNWIEANSAAEHFSHFTVIFEYIEKLLLS